MIRCLIGEINDHHDPKSETQNLIYLNFAFHTRLQKYLNFG